MLGTSPTNLAAPADRSRTPFVGRGRELAMLRGALDDTCAGRSTLVLVEGEAGIGKTRLLREVEAAARASGASVRWGRGWEGSGAPGYWPWIQVLRAVARECDIEHLVELLGPAVGDLAGFLPELVSLTGVALPPPALEPEQMRFRIFDSFGRALRAAAEQRPQVVLLDDVHCADGDSLLLLEFLAAHVVDCPLLLVATHRSEEASHGVGFARCLTALARLPHALACRLAGLSEGDVSALLRSVLGHRASAGLAAAVHRRTEGNPLFVAALLPLLQERWDRMEPDADLPAIVPDSVRKLIMAQLLRLPEGTRTILEAAAVLGREFDLGLLGRLCTGTLHELISSLEPAVAARIVTADRRGAGRYRFTHVLLRDALYEGMPDAFRLAHHHAIARAFEASDASPAHLVGAAHHFLEALPIGDSEHAIAVTRRAAERAVLQHSYDTAIALLERALASIEVAGGSTGTRCDLLVALGDAQRIGGHLPEARATFTRAAAVARELGSPDLFARAALGLAEPWTDFGQVDELRTRLLGEAFAWLGPETTPLHVRVLARLAPALHGTGTHDRMVAMAVESVAKARVLGDPVTQLYALGSAHLTMRGPAYLGERAAFAREMRAIAERERDLEMCMRVRLLELVDVAETGDALAIDAALAAAARLADELRQPRYLWQVLTSRAALAAQRGRFAQAERIAQEAWTIGRQSHVSLADLFLHGLLGSIRRVQGRLGEMSDALVDTAAHIPGWGIARVYLPRVQLALGRRDEARHAFQREVDEKLSALPQDIYWTFTMGLLCELCAALDDGPRADRLYEALQPYSNRMIVLGSISACEGAVASSLGLLASAARRWDLAEGHFTAAIAQESRAAALPALARTRFWFARMLDERAAPGDRERARELRESACDDARALGIRSLELTGGATLDGRERDDPPRLPATAAPAVRNHFVREGEYWTLDYAGSTIRLRSTKGLGHIASLLARSGVDVHVLELDPDGVSDAMQSPSSLAADPRARAEYRRRLHELRDEIVEAEQRCDLGRVAACRAEIERVAAELQRDRRPGGRPRTGPSPAERARVRVRNDIVRALEAIRPHHPALWRHLFNGIRTGTFCSYRPEVPVVWTF